MNLRLVLSKPSSTFLLSKCHTGEPGALIEALVAGQQRSDEPPGGSAHDVHFCKKRQIVRAFRPVRHHFDQHVQGALVLAAGTKLPKFLHPLPGDEHHRIRLIQPGKLQHVGTGGLGQREHGAALDGLLVPPVERSRTATGRCGSPKPEARDRSGPSGRVPGCSAWGPATRSAVGTSGMCPALDGST